jgi:hypothetical protein
MDLELGRFIMDKVHTGPNGDYAECMKNKTSTEWTLAIILNAIIEDTNKFEGMKRQKGIYFCEKFNAHWHSLHFVESFENVLRVASTHVQSSSFHFTEEFSKDIQKALADDVARFEKPVPEYLTSVNAFKTREIYRMLKEMECQHTDEYELVSQVYKVFQSRKLRYSNHTIKMMESTPINIIQNHMTLLERIQALEAAVFTPQ